MKKTKLILAMTSALVAQSAYATNGMNLEGYGSKATAMGGASMAYDSGNSAVMNNPATLALMPEGEKRLGFGLRMLGPDVATKHATAGSAIGGSGLPDTTGQTAPSSGSAYYMPSFSYIRKNESIAYGVAVQAQGGMGTDYDKDSFLAYGTDKEVRSELGVGRIMLPFARRVNDKFTWGAQLDVVWAQLDIMMAAPAGDLFGNGYYTGGNGSLNTGLAQPFETLANTGAGSTGGLLGTILTPTINGAIDNYVGRVDFSDDNDFTGKAFGYGLGGKLGFTFKANDKLTIGGAYHTKTNISDMETSDSAATLAFYNAADGSPLNNGSYTGKITVKDFQWPSTLALGAAFQATPKLMLVADVKRINWSEIIKDFNMTFTDANGGGTLDFTIPQNWEDQTVFQVGGQYQVNDKLAVRAGYNYGKNPVPDNKLQPLFPATPEQHITAGFGYTVDNKNSFAASMVYVPEVKNTSTVSQDTAGTFDITHSQLNVSFNYVRKL